jgi:hypothetical protein
VLRRLPDVGFLLQTPDQIIVGIRGQLLSVRTGRTRRRSG